MEETTEITIRINNKKFYLTYDKNVQKICHFLY